MIDDLTEDQYNKREAFARYGLALYHAQCLERTIALLLTFNDASGRKITVFQIDYELEEAFKKTFGILIERLKAKGLYLAKEVVDKLETALQIRNRLAHDYWWENAIAITRPEFYGKIIEEMDNYSQLFSELDSFFMKSVTDYSRTYGASDTFINNKMNEYKNSPVVFDNFKQRILKKKEKIIKIFKYYHGDPKIKTTYIPVFVLEDRSNWTLGDSGLYPISIPLDLSRCEDDIKWTNIYPCEVTTKPDKVACWDYKITLSNGHVIIVKPHSKDGAITYKFCIK